MDTQPRGEQRLGRDDPPEAGLDGVVEASSAGPASGTDGPGQVRSSILAAVVMGSPSVRPGRPPDRARTAPPEPVSARAARVARDGGLDVGRVHAVVGHRADLAVRVLDHQDAARPERLEERRPVAGHLEQHEVRPDPARVETPGGGLRGPARGLDPVHLAEGLGEAPRVGVVLGEAVDHAVRAVAERDQSGRGKDPRLAHPAADHLARAARAPDHVLRPDDHRSDRAGQTLREAERDRVGRPREVRAVTPASRWATTAFQNRAPSTWNGTPCRWAIAATASV